MPRGDKSSYTGKQKRKAEHIEKGYEKRGVGKLACKDAPVINPIATHLQTAAARHCRKVAVLFPAPLSPGPALTISTGSTPRSQHA